MGLEEVEWSTTRKWTPSPARGSIVLTHETEIRMGERLVPAIVELSYLVADEVLHEFNFWASDGGGGGLTAEDEATFWFNEAVDALGHRAIEVFVRAAYHGTHVAVRIDHPELREQAKPARD